ncbi:MAG: MATE family efflux transporter [Gemmatimonas sp.]|jgi:MATE family multidrug resistance protein|uniref:MATE family efflux transporter n=1 Tax=Gemmatimonas sp. TaxID=1962908 RepID=UPI00391F9C9D|nr:MATE family efflux transporter [Gemmatimonadota bacterium]
MGGWRDDLRDMTQVAVPIVLINLGIQAMGVVDALMVGRLGGQAIAAVALGNFYFFNVCVFGIGLLFAIDPVVAQAVGAGDQEAIARGVQRGLVLATMVSVVVMLALLPGEWLLGALRQPPEVIDATAVYARRRILGVLPFFVFNVFRQSLQAMGPVRPVIAAALVANLVNAGANWLLIFGNGGAPALGVAGAGYATAISMWVMALALTWFAWPLLQDVVRPWRPDTLARVPMWRMVRMGAPIGVQWFFESFAFGLTALFMGWMSTASLAGHEIALNMAALTFMVPLGISGAAAAAVGRAIGRGDLASAQRDAMAAIICGVGFMCVSGVVFIAAPEWLATRYTREAATVAVAVALIPLAGWFQVFDGLQAVTSGVLRGTGDTRIPAILHLVAFWGIGIPLGAYLGFRTPLRERGLWIGLVAGLAAAAALQSARVAHRLRGPITRVSVDH